MPPGVGEDAGVLPKATLPKLGLEVIVLLAADDKVGSDILDVMKTLEVVVTTVEDIERVLFVGDEIHRLRIVNFGRGYMEERRDLCFNIV